jgi:hypothetical protein
VIDVAMVHVGRAVALTEDGQELPITNAFDDDGDDCDLADAVTCVAGPDRDGMWLTINLTMLERVTLQ